MNKEDEEGLYIPPDENLKCGYRVDHKTLRKVIHNKFIQRDNQ